eukprot:1468773-Amphidinium_carterae.1
MSILAALKRKSGGGYAPGGESMKDALAAAQRVEQWQKTDTPVSESKPRLLLTSQCSNDPAGTTTLSGNHCKKYLSSRGPTRHPNFENTALIRLLDEIGLCFAL